MKQNGLAIWNIVGAFLLPYSIVFYITNVIIPGDDFLIISIPLHLCLILIAPAFSFVLLYLDRELQLLLNEDSPAKGSSLLKIACILLAPFILLLNLNVWLAVVFSSGMLLWSFAAAYWQVRQSKLQHEKAKRG